MFKKSSLSLMLVAMSALHALPALGASDQDQGVIKGVIIEMGASGEKQYFTTTSDLNNNLLEKSPISEQELLAGDQDNDGPADFMYVPNPTDNLTIYMNIVCGIKTYTYANIPAGNNSANALAMATLVASHHPEFFFGSTSISYSNGYLTYTTMTPDKIAKLRQVRSIAKQIVSQLNVLSKPNLYDRVKAIHDYIVLNTDYDLANYQRGTIPVESYTAWGVLINKRAVCEGYTAAFNLLADLSGINSLGVAGSLVGKKSNHAWNEVLPPGGAQLFYVDTTWDDPTVNGQVNPQSYRTNYLYVPESTMAGDHAWNRDQYKANYLRFIWPATP